MKRIFTLLMTLLLATSVFAQTPQKMSYQAVIRNLSNTLVANQAVGMRISILQGSSSGTAVYAETQTPTTNANGLISIEIGGGTTVSGNFTTIDWANGLYFIKTETDPSGGTNYTITGTSQLLSVPYALHAKTAEAVTGHYVGEQFGGGIIFHLWKDSAKIEHGLIVDLADLSASSAWSNVVGTLNNPAPVGISGQSYWDGLGNSNAIVAQPGHTASAASLCLNSTNGGQTDWYLPAIDELILLLQNRFNINKALNAIVGATPLSTTSDYWSSTEPLNDMTGAVAFSGVMDNYANISSQPVQKGYNLPVRAIRAF